MYKIPANTLFMGKQLVFVPECHSTNTLALQLVQNPSTIEGTVIITNNQTAGRGQRGNSWEAASGMNLTFSVILKPGFLAVKDQFALTIIISLAVRDFLHEEIELPVTIKWPNDVLVHQKKICGILIENVIQGTSLINAIVGIGLNINQVEFQSPSATSLKLVINKDTSIEKVLHRLLECLEKRYLQLKHQQYVALKNEYLLNLHWMNETHTFLSNKIPFEGIIKGVDDQGKLVVDTIQGTKSFGIKEIQFLE